MSDITEAYLVSFVPERFLKDEHYRNGHIRILAPSPGTRILGMHTPQMKKVARDLVKSGRWQEQLAAWAQHSPLTGADGLTHEERMIWGLVIDYAKVPLEERLPLIESFIPAIDNWALCDNFCCNAKWVEKENKLALRPFVEQLIGSREEYRARTGLILSLAHYLDSENIAHTLSTVNARSYQDSDPYYIRMGAAWLFAEALCKNYDLALEYLKAGKLSRWIHNKAIQKARESYRITPAQKHHLQTLKRSPR